ncbi:MAG: hypothetical protein M3Y87_06650 [Myxococcota bacterium]|nr:hypothetical protein [Myxococcota bacterium]
MSVAIALAALAIIDCVLCGFRAAAGTDGRVDKRAFYRRALARALVAGVVVVGAHVLLVAALVSTSSDPTLTWDAFVEAGTICVATYGVLATTIVITLAFHFAPIEDIRVLTSVIVLGPLTLARPTIIAVGLALAVASTADVRVGIAALSAGISMLSFEWLIGRRHATRWRHLLEPR